MLRRLIVFILSFSAAGFGCSCFNLDLKPCKWGKTGNVAFVGTVLAVDNLAPETNEEIRKDNGMGAAHYRFRVDEPLLGGIKTREVDVYSGRGGGDCSYHFKAGRQYLVVPYQLDAGQLHATICSPTREWVADDPLIEELRAVREHRKVASAFGTVGKVDRDSWDIPPVPVSGVKVHFSPLEGSQSDIVAITDSKGNYRIYDLPEGPYQITADLPAGLELDGMYGLNSGPRFSAGACANWPLFAAPSGRIHGRVLDEKGEPVSGIVELLRNVSQISASDLPREFAGDKGFEFKHVSPGPYLLVFNRRNEIDPDVPYLRTFYPGTIEPELALPIDLAEGQQVAADIHLSGGRPVQHIAVSVVWGNGSPVVENPLWVSGSPTEGKEARGRKISAGVYELNLLRGLQYSVKALFYCGSKPMKASSTLEVSESTPAKLTIAFPEKSMRQIARKTKSKTTNPKTQRDEAATKRQKVKTINLETRRKRRNSLKIILLARHLRLWQDFSICPENPVKNSSVPSDF